MKQLAILSAILMSTIAAFSQVTTPEPPVPPADPAAPSINIHGETVTIHDKRGNVFIINDNGISRNGVIINGDADDLADEMEDLQEDISELKVEAGALSAESDEYEELMEDIDDLEEELALLEDMGYQNASPDTLPDSTTVTIGPWKLTVKEDEDGGDDISFGKFSDEEDEMPVDDYVDVFETKWFLFDLGFNTYLNADNGTEIPAPYDAFEDQKTWGSWDVNLHLFRQRLNIAHGHINLNWGLSFEWHNYRFNSDFVILPEMDSVTLLFESEEGEAFDFKKNRFSTTHFTLPVILGFETKPTDTDHSFRMGFGYSPGLMMTGKTKIVEDGDTQKVKDDFNLEKFRHELNYIIGFGGLNFYASYDLNGMFKEGEGPELHPFSIGLIINRGF